MYMPDAAQVMLLSMSLLMMYPTIHFLQETLVYYRFNTSYASECVFIYDVSNNSFLTGNTSICQIQHQLCFLVCLY